MAAGARHDDDGGKAFKLTLTSTYRDEEMAPGSVCSVLPVNNQIYLVTFVCLTVDTSLI